MERYNYRCKSCGHEFSYDILRWRCPDCGESNLELLAFKRE